METPVVHAAPASTPARRGGAGVRELFIVFMASFCTLVLELVAGRVMAPYVGVSIFTWTSIIGVILLGISVGNYIGGLVADRFEPRRSLGLILLAGGALSLAILFFITFVPDLVQPAPIVLRIVLMTTLLFLAPTLVLGMVSPVVIKIAIKDLRQTGSVAGRIYAFSTVGAIAGTFITGFVLVSTIGTRVTILAVAVILLLMGLVFGDFRRRTTAALGLVPLVLAFTTAWAGFSQNGLISGCAIESHYFCIKVYDETVDGHQVKTLVLDHLIHSYTDLNDPYFLHYEYLRNYADLTEYLRQQQPGQPLRTLFLGGGGYTLPRMFAAAYPDAHIEVIEVDPGVVRANHELMGLDPNTRIITHAMDARIGIAEVRLPKYDIIFGDAFNDVSVPYHLATREFARQIRNLLTEDGYYAALVIDNATTGRFLVSYARTLQEVFPYVSVMGSKGSWQGRGLGTWLVVAGTKELDTAAVERTVAPGQRASSTGFMPRAFFDEWIRRNDPVILTDDFAPVDNLLAPQVIARN